MTAREPPSREAIIEVVERHVRPSIQPLDDSSLLDLDRERAAALFSELARRFEFTGEVAIDSYFDGFQIYIEFPEFSPLLRLFYPRLRQQWRKAPPRPAIPLAHLVTVVQAGVWRDPPPRDWPDPLVWVGQKSLTPIFRALKVIAYGMGYVLAAGFFVVAFDQLVRTVSAAADSNWPTAIAHLSGVVLYSFFVLMMAESTQRQIEDRFGLLWDWRRGRLREPRRVPIRP